MSLTIIKSPSAFQFSRNDIIYKVRTNNLFDVSGTASFYEMKFDGDPADGDSIELSFLNYTLNFLFKTAPDNSGLQLPLRGVLSWGNYLDNLVEALQANYLIDKYYTITAGGSGSAPYYIYILSKEKDVVYNFTASVSSANVSFNEINAGITQVKRKDYAVMFRPIIADERQAEERVPPLFENSQYVSEINIKDFTSQVKSSLLFPGTTGTIIHSSPDLKKCWIEYAEYYDLSVRKVLSSESSDYVYVLNGGLDTRKLSELNDDDISMLEFIRDRKDFLTHKPISNYVLSNQHELLSYLILDINLATINVKIEATWRNGNTSTNVAESAQAGYMQLKDFDVTPFRLTLNLWDPTGASAWPYKYKVWLEDQDGEMLTVGRTYEIVEATRYDHQFIFRNSFGRYDTIRMTGRGLRESSIERETVDYNRQDADLSLLQFQKQHNNAFEQQTLTVNTGWFDKVNPQSDVYRDFLRDFAMSREIYEVVNGKLYPSLVVNSNIVSQKDDDMLEAVEFELIRAYTDEHYVRDMKLIADQYFTEEFNERFVTE